MSLEHLAPDDARDDCRLVVLTGGPGAGKTAVLEIVRKQFCAHVAVLPEAASIVFRGGFPRLASDAGRRAAQRLIGHTQRELERIAIEEYRPAVALCDRGTLDGMAYWPGPPDEFLRELGTTREAELARYAAVIHLRTPDLANGYDHSNPLRIETAAEAAAIDQRIELAWEGHPHRAFIDASADFLAKVAEALELIRRKLPWWCHDQHRAERLAAATAR